MGTIRKTTNTDYSAGAVAKYDFDKNILRRVIAPGQLERNYVLLNGNVINGFSPISLAGSYVVIKADVQFSTAAGGTNIFYSAADYATQRGFALIHSYSGGANFTLQLVNIVGGATFYNSISVAAPVSPATTGVYEIEYAADFANKKILYLKVNGVFITLPAIQNGTPQANAWANGQTRTVCFGNVACYTPDTGLTLASRVMYAQVKNDKGDILSHFDFIGDNRAEVFTDKAKLQLLAAPTAVSYVSLPVNF